MSYPTTGALPFQNAVPENDWCGPPPQKIDFAMAAPCREEDAISAAITAKLAGTLSGQAFTDLVQMIPARLQVKSRQIFIWLAILVMFLMLAIPVSNCIGLFNDGVYIYMVGNQTISWLLVMCVALFFLSVTTLLVYLSRSAYDSRTAQTLFIMGGIFLSSLGIILILHGIPIMAEVRAASEELIRNCGSGPKSAPIYHTFQDLGQIRSNPACSKLESIEDCADYGQYVSMPIRASSADIVKTIETHYHCSGFCAGTDANGRRAYPPTLFSVSNYKKSCDGTVMRHMNSIVSDLARAMVAEGVILVGTAIAVSFGMVIGFCTWSTRQEKAAPEGYYGATL